jgi:hypothetical protein
MAVCRDVAVIHPNGYGEIVGRMKDMIIRGGENIYPRFLNSCRSKLSSFFLPLRKRNFLER